ncbi:uncharacterized protein [Antedon mediterranea]|uniref:uncharacterized protein n=1 Tax=Antedon mediterranea TaxID=105859 RepID=UPI003AF45803
MTFMNIYTCVILCAIVLNQFLLIETAGSCKDEAVENTIEVLFNKDGNILRLDEWNDKSSDIKFQSVMANGATNYCRSQPSLCSLIEYNETSHPFEEDNVVFIGSTPTYSNGYVKIEFYIKLTGIETVFDGSLTTYVLRKSTLKNITVESVDNLNFNLNFTTAFVDGDLVTVAIDNSLDKIIIPIAVAVLLILLLIMQVLRKTHDELEELKRKHGYGSRTKVSPGIIELQKKVEHTEDKDLNPESKYNNSAYGHHGHVPRIGLPQGPAPYAYPRRSFKTKPMAQEAPSTVNEEVPPPAYEESLQKTLSEDASARNQENEEDAQKQSIEDEEPVTVPEPVIVSEPVPDVSRRLPPLVPITRKDPVGKEDDFSNNNLQTVEGIPGIIKVEKEHNYKPSMEKEEKQITYEEKPEERKEEVDPIVKDTLPTNDVSVVKDGISEFQENQKPADEIKKEKKKKHKKHKHKHRHNSDGESERDGHDRSADEGHKRKKHRKKKKKHRHKHSDNEEDEENK